MKIISNKKVLILMSFALLILSSCTPQVFKGFQGYKSITGTENLLYTPTIADLEVKPDKIEGISELNLTNGVVGNVENLKENAVSDALRKSKADVMIEPRYEIINSSSKTTVNVIGYAAYYKNFRTADTASIALIRKGLSVMNTAPITTNNKVSSNNVQPNPSKNKNGKVWLILGIIFIAPLLIYGLISLANN